jgi:peptidoglycan/LPS O-acetylase OafA/YrhL
MIIFQPFAISYSNLLTFTRIVGLFIGCLHSFYKMKNPLNNINPTNTFSIIILSIITLCCYEFLFQSYLTLQAVSYTLTAITFGIVLNEIVSRNNSLFSKLFLSKTLIFFGRISYSLYIFHWSIYLILISILFNSEKDYTGMQNNALSVPLVSTFIAIIISALSYYLIKKGFCR